MNRLFFVKTDPLLPMFELMKQGKEQAGYRHPHVAVRHTTFCFFDSLSFRDKDVSQEEGPKELQRIFFSNSHDYLMASTIRPAMATIRGETLLNEKGKVIYRIGDGDISAYHRQDVALPDRFDRA